MSGDAGKLVRDELKMQLNTEEYLKEICYKRR